MPGCRHHCGARSNPSLRQMFPLVRKLVRRGMTRTAHPRRRLGQALRLPLFSPTSPRRATFPVFHGRSDRMSFLSLALRRMFGFGLQHMVTAPRSVVLQAGPAEEFPSAPRRAALSHSETQSMWQRARDIPRFRCLFIWGGVTASWPCSRSSMALLVDTSPSHRCHSKRPAGEIPRRLRRVASPLMRRRLRARVRRAARFSSARSGDGSNASCINRLSRRLGRNR